SKLNRHCCKNGGTCILGSFCACPKYFTGRYCDFDERKRDCGAVLHGNWLQKDCSLCKCQIRPPLKELLVSFFLSDEDKYEEEILRILSMSSKLQPTGHIWLFTLFIFHFMV
uniref:EGF-like domain-containing protein n=1 Tax=Terrapene triunguis TaxID=2587831 RepID=A0A674JFW1_9SAUR